MVEADIDEKPYVPNDDSLSATHISTTYPPPGTSS